MSFFPPVAALEYAKTLAGLGINNFIIFILNDRLRLNFYLAKLIAVGTVTCWNFLMNYLVTFR